MLAVHPQAVDSASSVVTGYLVVRYEGDKGYVSNLWGTLVLPGMQSWDPVVSFMSLHASLQRFSTDWCVAAYIMHRIKRFLDVAIEIIPLWLSIKSETCTRAGVAPSDLFRDRCSSAQRGRQFRDSEVSCLRSHLFIRKGWLSALYCVDIRSVLGDSATMNLHCS